MHTSALGTAWTSAPEAIAAQAVHHPEAVAMVCGARALPYGALLTAADRLAGRLRALGVGPDVLVGLCAHRSVEAVVGMLGVLRAGGAFVPLDPTYPHERLAFFLEDARPALVLVSSGFEDRLPPTPAPLLPLEWPVDGPVPPAVPPSPDHLAYVVYTSGSTGRPKGVAIEHRGLANSARELARAFGLEPASRVLQFAPLGFDGAVGEVFPTLVAGSCLVIPPAGGLVLGEELVRFLDASAASVAVLPPSVLATLPRAPLPSLRAVVSVGEACSPELVARWAPGRRFLNGYGPTEVTVAATLAECRPDGTAPPIGRPLANVRLHVLDAEGRAVPTGEPGELYVAGDGVARGYLGRPDLTAERFVHLDGERVYRTGDRVRWRPDGQLAFLGRVDRQVKLRGFRVELGEIEAALLEDPAVVACAVVAVGEREERRLVAYVVPSEGAGTDGVRERLAARLPAFMVPGAWVALDAMPLTPNGKVDLAALPEPTRSGEGRVAPRTPLEAELVAIWEEVLGVTPVGVEDDFFALGGHSLLAVRLAATIERRLGCPFPVRVLFEARTVAAQAERLATVTATPASPLVVLRATGSRSPLFLVHPGGGHALCYAPLAEALGEDQPVYAFEERFAGGDRLPRVDVEALAEDYLRVLRARAPDGPYHLAGWSFGGLVAFEMARRLVAEGAEVGSLHLLDTRFFAGIVQLDPADALVWEARRLGWDGAFPADTDLATALDVLAPDVARAQGWHPTDARRTLACLCACIEASARYQPGPYSGPLTLLRARDALPGAALPDATFDWSRWCEGAYSVRFVPGTHASMVSPPHVGSLAAAMQGLLEGAGTPRHQGERAQPGA